MPALQPGVWAPKKAGGGASGPDCWREFSLVPLPAASGRDLLTIRWPVGEEAGFEEATPAVFGLWRVGRPLRPPTAQL